MNGKPQFKSKGVLIAVAILVVAGAVWYAFFRPEQDTLSVPLGVEQAAIITYSGPLVTVAPYKWGVAVNVRIANVTERQDTRIYDVRYIVNRGGTFDLKDYLAAENGAALEGLPSFKFIGDPKLSKNLDTRIQETEEIRVDVGGRYYETMTGLTVLWLVWLLLLIFYKRPRPLVEPDGGPPAPTLTELLRGFLTRLEAGTLDAEGKAKMEMVLMQRWRDELALGQVPMSEALDAISRNDKTGGSLRKLQQWLYHPASPVTSSEIAALIAPYTRDALSSAPASAS